MNDLSPGFTDPVGDAQTCFRAVLDAMAHPGRTYTVHGLAAPAPLNPAAASVLLTLIDQETPLGLDPGAAAAHDWITFHTGAALNMDNPAFVLALTLPDLATLPAGTDEAPESSATIILQVAAFGTGQRLSLEGPGLREPARVAIDGLPPGFAAIWQANHALFPRGIDLILCAGHDIMALPRSVTVKEH
jgi:alpha-D-ribose 1-methylphosphonate 5-triphosphate synthase subunit PhnH